MKEALKKLLVRIGLRHPAKGIKIRPSRKAEILLAHKTPAMTVFVETGTYRGDMTETMKNYFQEIHSVELDARLYMDATKRFRDERKVHLYHGDSARYIYAILSRLTSPALFWLDAHDTGEITFRNSPVEAELQAIVTHPVRGHSILIDDARHFNRRDIRSIRRLARSNNYRCAIEEGLFRLTPREN